MRHKLLLAVCFLAIFSSCGNRRETGKTEPITAAATPPPPPTEQDVSKQESALVSSNSPASGAVSGAYANGDTKKSLDIAGPRPEKKVTFTADFKCRVKSVFTTVKDLEGMTKALGGVVQESNMENTINDTRTVNTEDSIKEYHAYTTSASLILKVPAGSFDSVIHALPEMVEFIDSRTVRENDVSLQYYNNKLRAEASARRLEELKNINLARKNGTDIAEYKDRLQDEQTTRQVENLAIGGNVTFATITLQLTQPQQVYARTVLNTTTIGAGHFGTKCGAALAEGVDIIKTIIIGFLTVWPLLLVAAAIILGYRLYRKKYYREFPPKPAQMHS